MASGIGLSLDTSFLQSLEKVDNKIKDLTNKTNALSRATVQAFQQMANSGVVPYIEQLNRQKKALEEIGKIKGTSPLLTKMQADAKVAVDEINNLIKALEKTKAYKGGMSGKTAISFANSVLGQRGEAKSIDNMKLAINQLEAAQNRLNLNTKTGQKNYEKIGETIKKVKAELDKATGANKELTNESQKTSDAVSGIGKNISIAFAVNAIRTFTKQLIDVRGEFELQHRSLQVLLQDIDEANALWEKTTALAVKSPYRVKELVTYTKQLAAYRVEADKLYDTTRMLADVSSGLGVDMNRLILAFGQVKAANFLRGTELRQFSEAGVNLLEELSKRFTQLEGRAVSVGDVFERVSKRMVSFADVEAVFQTITSEGGVFYQMQEKQSETLRGMWMNLMDSIDLALNDIGRNGSDILKGAVKLTKEIVDNWRKLVPIIAGAGTTLFAYFSVASLTAIGKAVGSLVNPWALVAGAVAGLTVGIISAIKAQRELTAEMNRIDTEVRGQLEDSTALYMKLTKAVNDVTSSEKERNKALDQLKAKFADILPDQMLELEYIQGIANNYSEATDAMINYYTAKAREQKKDKVESHYAEEIEGTDIPELITATRNAINKLSEKGFISSDIQLALLGSVKYALNAVTEKVKAGEISSEYNSVRNAIFTELEKYSGYKGSLFDDLLNINTVLFDEQVKDVSKTLSGLKRDLENIPQFSLGSYAKDEAAKAFLPEKENIAKAKEVFKSMITEFSLLSQQTSDTWNGADEAIFDMISKLPPEMSAYADLLSQMFEKLKIAAQKGGFEFKAAIQGLQQDFTFELPNALWSQTGESMFGPMSEGIREELVQLVTNMQGTLSDEAKNLELTDFQNSVIGVFRNVAKEVKGADLNVFKDFIPDLKKSRGEIIKELNALETQYTDTVAAFEKSLSEGVSPMMAEHIHQVTEEQIAWMKANIPALDEAAKRLGENEKKKKGRTDNTIEERIKVVDQMNAKYKELNKTLSKTDALQGAFDAYKDAFATAYGREDVRTMKVEDFVANVLNFPNEDAVVKWLDDLAKTVADKEDKIKVQLAKGKFEMDIDVRAKKEKDQELFKDIQNMFDQYDLSLELKKLNVAPEVAKSLFGVESVGLKDIRKKVEDELASAKTIGGQEDRVKQLEKDLEKINDMEDKSLKERMKKYIKYSRESLGKMGEIRLEQLQTIRDINEAFEEKDGDSQEVRDIKAQERLRAITKATEDANEAMAKLQWEEFRKSESFTELFSDLEIASDEVLDNAIKRLEEFKEQWKDLPVDQMKEVDALLRKAKRAKDSDDNPWANARDIRSRIQADGRTAEQAMLDSAAAAANKAQLTEELQMIDLINQKRNEGVADEEIAIVLGERYVGLLGDEVDLVKKRNDIEGKIGQKQMMIDSAQDRIQDEKDLIKMYKSQEKALQEINKMAQDLYGSFKELYESLGGEGDDAFAVFADMGMQMASTVLQTFALKAQLDAAAVSATGFGAAMNTAMGVIGWIVMGVQLLTQAISAVAKIKDNKIVAQLEEQAAIIEKQRDLYEQIEEKVEKAYNVEHLRQYNKQLQNSIELEIQALEASIALEQSRKKADQGQIDAWKKEVTEARKRLAETKQEMVEELGGMFDLTDFTSEFIDAWWEAMDEGMSGLDALNEHFEETMKDMVKKQALWQGAQNIMKQVQDVINQDLANDYDIDDWKKIWDVAKKANVDLDEFLKGWYDMFGSMSEGTGGSLSALQKGIQGITEDTAQIIEAYLNSIRGYVSEQVAYTKRLYEMFDRMSRGNTYGLNVRMIS